MFVITTDNINVHGGKLAHDDLEAITVGLHNRIACGELHMIGSDGNPH